MYRPKIYVYEEKSKYRNSSSLLLITTLPAGKRKKEALSLYCATIPKNFMEKKDREAKFQIATQIANERQRDFLRGVYDIPQEFKVNEDFISFAKCYLKQQSGILVETRKYDAALTKFKEFLVKDACPYYTNGKLPCIYLTENLLKRWVKYMEGHLRGETPRGYLSRLKIMIRAAISESYFKNDPSINVSARQIGSISKEVLTVAEIQKLWQTPIKNDQVRKAFLFACSTGLRFCDVKNLKWENIVGERLHIIQKKTGNELTLPLKEETLDLLGERKNSQSLVFNLCSHTGVAKWLIKWAELAGIEKKITFHVSRHSLATNLIAHNVNLVVASKILGHVNIKQTQQYVRVSETLKEDALKQFSFNK